MAYNESTGKRVNTTQVTPIASAARTATHNSGWRSSRGKSTLCLTSAVTAASGTTPTLDVSIETSANKDGSDSRSLGAFAQQTDVNSARKSFSGVDRYYRVVCTIGGTTPSFTHSVSGDAK